MERFTHQPTDRDPSLENLPVFDVLLAVAEALNDEQREKLLEPLNKMMAVVHRMAATLQSVAKEEDLCYFCRRMVRASEKDLARHIVERPGPDRVRLRYGARGRAPRIQVAARSPEAGEAA